MSHDVTNKFPNRNSESCEFFSAVRSLLGGFVLLCFPPSFGMRIVPSDSVLQEIKACESHQPISFIRKKCVESVSRWPLYVERWCQMVAAAIDSLAQRAAFVIFLFSGGKIWLRLHLSWFPTGFPNHIWSSNWSDCISPIHGLDTQFIGLKKIEPQSIPQEVSRFCPFISRVTSPWHEKNSW